MTNESFSDELLIVETDVKPSYKQLQVKRRFLLLR